MVVAQPSPGGVALRHVLPVLCMTLHLAVVGRMAMRGLNVTKYSTPSGVVIPG